MEAPIQAQRNICDMVVHVSNYVDSIRSGAGRLLNEQKVINRALDTFGSMRLSQLTKQGIQDRVQYNNEFILILENFLKTHPDFSYNNARGIIFFTGEDGNTDEDE